MGVENPIDSLMKALRAHRDGADRVFSEDVMSQVKTLAKELGIDLAMSGISRPRSTDRMQEVPLRSTIAASAMSC